MKTDCQYYRKGRQRRVFPCPKFSKRNYISCTSSLTSPFLCKNFLFVISRDDNDDLPERGAII